MAAPQSPAMTRSDSAVCSLYTKMPMPTAVATHITIRPHPNPVIAGRHNDGMHLRTREDEDRGPTRTIVWSDASESDLAGVLAAMVAATSCVASIVFAVELHGPPHGALVGSDTYSVGVPGLLTGPLLIAVVIAVLRASPMSSPRAHRRAQAIRRHRGHSTRCRTHNLPVITHDIRARTTRNDRPADKLVTQAAAEPDGVALLVAGAVGAGTPSAARTWAEAAARAAIAAWP